MDEEFQNNVSLNVFKFKKMENKSPLKYIFPLFLGNQQLPCTSIHEVEITFVTYSIAELLIVCPIYRWRK